MIWIFVLLALSLWHSLSQCFFPLVCCSPILFVFIFLYSVGFGGDEYCVLYIMAIPAFVTFNVWCFLSPSHFNSVLFRVFLRTGQSFWIATQYHQMDMGLKYYWTLVFVILTHLNNIMFFFLLSLGHHFEFTYRIILRRKMHTKKHTHNRHASWNHRA